MRKRNWLMGGAVAVLLVLAGWELNPREVRAANEPTLRESPMEGARCEVFFRRDYIATYVKEETSGLEIFDDLGHTHLSWRKSLSGTLIKLNDQWVAVQYDDGRQAWIPRAAVVAIEVQPK